MQLSHLQEQKLTFVFTAPYWGYLLLVLDTSGQNFTLAVSLRAATALLRIRKLCKKRKYYVPCMFFGSDFHSFISIAVGAFSQFFSAKIHTVICYIMHPLTKAGGKYRNFLTTSLANLRFMKFKESKIRIKHTVLEP